MTLRVFPFLTHFFHLRQPSLLRGIILSLCALFFCLFLAGFPDLHTPYSSHWQVIVLLLACLSIGDTARCLNHRWSFYHAGVLLLLYANLFLLALAACLLFFS